MPDVTVPAAPPLARIPNVQLVRTGTWALSTGSCTFSRDDLAAAVGALNCPAVRRPVIKLGHIDERFDGEPAVGWVDNLRLAAGGHSIVGDYVGMPGWLGQVIASAYPDRSIEGYFNWGCQLGHTHPFVLTAVALLGVTRPGVGALTSLQDVAALYGVQAAAETDDGGGVRVAVTVHASNREDTTMPNPAPRQVAAGVSAEDIRREFNQQAPMDLWICEIQLDPLQLIVADDSSGQYARVPIELTGDDTFSFGDPVPVVVRYVDQPTTPAAGGQPASDGAPVAASVFASRAESRPGPDQPAGPVSAATGGPIPYKKTATSDGAWSASKMTGRLPADADAATLRDMYAWVDPAGNPGTKGAYKLPHHEVGTDGTVGAANVAACRSAIGVLNGARGGAAGIPDGDVAAVYAHLSKHLKDANVTPPELSTSSSTKAAAASEAGGQPAPTDSGAEPDPIPTTLEDDVSTDLSGLRSALGLADDADLDAAIAAVTELRTKAEQPTTEPVAASAPDGTVTVDEQTLNELKVSAAAGREAMERFRREDRDRHIAAAVDAGKIAPARVEHWTRAWDADPDGTKSTLDGLAEGLVVPVAAKGSSNAPDRDGEQDMFAEFDRLFTQPAVTKEN